MLRIFPPKKIKISLARSSWKDVEPLFREAWGCPSGPVPPAQALSLQGGAASGCRFRAKSSRAGGRPGLPQLCALAWSTLRLARPANPVRSHSPLGRDHASRCCQTRHGKARFFAVRNRSEADGHCTSGRTWDGSVGRLYPRDNKKRTKVALRVPHLRSRRP